MSVHFTAVKRKVTHYVFRTHISNALRTWIHPLVNGGHGASPGRGGDGWKPESPTGANCPVPLQPPCPEDAWRQSIYYLWIFGFLCVWRHSLIYRSVPLRLIQARLQKHRHSGQIKVKWCSTDNNQLLWGAMQQNTTFMLSYLHKVQSEHVHVRV